MLTQAPTPGPPPMRALRNDTALAHLLAVVLPGLARQAEDEPALRGFAVVPLSAAEFREAIVRALPRLATASRRLTRSYADAEDLVQATCLRALEKQHRFVCGTAVSVAPWLLRMMYNLHLDRVRRGRFERPAPSLDSVPAPPPQPPSAWLMVDDDAVAAAIVALPASLRDVYRAYALEKLSYAAIAGRLRIPVATVGTRISRARARLRQTLSGGGGGDGIE